MDIIVYRSFRKLPNYCKQKIMTRHGQRCIWVLIVFLSLKTVKCTEGSEQNDDDGFCTKSEDGIRCTSLTDMGLTRLESQRVCARN